MQLDISVLLVLLAATNSEQEVTEESRSRKPKKSKSRTEDCKAKYLQAGSLEEGSSKAAEPKNDAKPTFGGTICLSSQSSTLPPPKTAAVENGCQKDSAVEVFVVLDDDDDDDIADKDKNSAGASKALNSFSHKSSVSAESDGIKKDRVARQKPTATVRPSKPETSLIVIASDDEDDGADGRPPQTVLTAEDSSKEDPCKDVSSKEFLSKEILSREFQSSVSNEQHCVVERKGSPPVSSGKEVFTAGKGADKTEMSTEALLSSHESAVCKLDVTEDCSIAPLQSGSLVDDDPKKGELVSREAGNETSSRLTATVGPQRSSDDRPTSVKTMDTLQQNFVVSQTFKTVGRQLLKNGVLQCDVGASGVDNTDAADISGKTVYSVEPKRELESKRRSPLLPADDIICLESDSE